jgi:dTDP-4-dehydrorhamnose 3,5-epimerase
MPPIEKGATRKWSLQRLAMRSDVRGTLVVLESGRDLPFAIQRVYYLYDTPPDADRGFHAHRRLQQLAIAMKGSCTFIVDDGVVREEVRLDSPTSGLLMPPMTWREMRNFSADCVLLVLASELFDEADYIRGYDEFRRLVAEAGPR